MTMTKEEYIALPADQRKKLAAKRSLERSAAAKAGLPIPPTLGEEFGLSPAKPAGERKIFSRKPKQEVTVGKATKAKKMEAQPRATMVPIVEVKAGPVASPIRTILGKLHCTKEADIQKYMDLALSKGFENKVTYSSGDKALGVIYYDELTDSEKSKIRAILAGSRKESRLTFKEGKIRGD